MSAPEVRVSTHQKHMMERENRKPEDKAAALRKLGSKTSDRLRPRMEALTRPHAVASPDRRYDEVDRKPPDNDGQHHAHGCFHPALRFSLMRKIVEQEGLFLPKTRPYYGEHRMLQHGKASYRASGVWTVRPASRRNLTGACC